MRDLETGSLWSHILGDCQEGKLLGAQLEFMASAMVPWKEWRARHPETTVLNLSRTAGDYRLQVFSNPDPFVFGVEVEQQPKAYPFAFLFKNNVVQETLKKTPVLVVFEPQSALAFIYRRALEDQELAFEPELTDGMLKDRATGSLWDPYTGQAKQGPQAGKTLPRLYGIVSFERAWRDFHPDSAFAN